MTDGYTLANAWWNNAPRVNTFKLDPTDHTGIAVFSDIVGSDLDSMVDVLEMFAPLDPRFEKASVQLAQVVNTIIDIYKDHQERTHDDKD